MQSLHDIVSWVDVIKSDGEGHRSLLISGFKHKKRTCVNLKHAEPEVPDPPLSLINANEESGVDEVLLRRNGVKLKQGPLKLQIHLQVQMEGSLAVIKTGKERTLPALQDFLITTPHPCLLTSREPVN